MNTLSLVKKSDTSYKLVIPQEVESKIRFICQKVWNTEWSGTLFFTYEGSFEDNNLTIRCQDIYVMDIGTQAYTEFDMNPDVISYMTDNPELLDCQMGLIHSHNNMATFFSGTDQQTLKEEGTDRNNFVSLIVNNGGTYTAAITRKIKHKKTIESISYEFFGEGERKDTIDYSNDTEIIEWFPLTIVKENNSFNFEDIETRLAEIRKNKSAVVLNNPVTNSNANFAKPDMSNEVIKIQKAQKTFFDDDPAFNEENSKIPYGSITFDKQKIKALLMQIVTGSVIMSANSKIDIVSWVKSSMPSLYEKRFGKDTGDMSNFKVWAETYAEYLIWSVSDGNLLNQGFYETEIGAICAHDLVEELSKLPQNDYIKGYIDALKLYIEV